MANRYETNEILDRIADALNDDQNSALIDALTTIANAILQGGGGDIPSGGTMGQLLGKRSNQDFDVMWYDNLGDDALSNQASVYNPQSNYVVGDYCLHTNYLHVCISPTTGNWDSTCWNRVQFGEQISTLNSNIATKVQTVNETPLKVFWMRETNVTFTSGAGSINLLNNVPSKYQNMSLFNAIVQCDSTSGSVILSATSNTNGVVSMVLKSVTDGSGITANVKVNIIFALY